jgi:pSer/pThr/pTyr-binding forkhead associated (FHA) protein
MPRLILKFDDREVEECAVGIHPVTIGRLPDNMLIIDSPAVSGRHARVYKEGTHYVLEDLKSTNGTFVNDRPIARYALLEGDRILVGKHTLVFTLKGSEQEADATAEPPASETGATMMPDTTQQKDLQADLDREQLYDAVLPKTAIPTAMGRIGVIKVVAGKSAQSEYTLSAMTTLIGKAATAQIRLTGWFKPQIAAAIVRKGEGFTLTPMGGKVSINGERIESRRDLAGGDQIEVDGLTLEFSLS